MAVDSDAGNASAMSVDEPTTDQPRSGNGSHRGRSTTNGRDDADEQAGSSTPNGVAMSSNNDEPPSFDAPPSSVVSKDGLQTSLVGHSARSQRSSSVRSNDSNPQASSEGQSKDLDSSKAYAVQHQQSEDKKQSQEQSIESLGENETAVRQRQSQERGDGEVAEQENDVTIRQESDNEGHDRLAVETEQHNKGGSASKDGPVKQVNYVKVVKKGDDCASCTSSGGTLRRPSLQKQLLKIVEFGDDLGMAVRTPEREDEESYDRHLSAPSVFLTVNDKNYAAFRKWSGEVEDDFALESEIVFDDIASHELYYDQIESFFEALHKRFDSLQDKSGELLLKLPDLGLELFEDNVYTREVALYDLDRIHVGCGLPGRLRVHVSSHPRFSTNFNLLTEHIAKAFDTGKMEPAHAVSPAAFREIVDEGSPKPERRRKNQNDRNGQAEHRPDQIDGEDDDEAGGDELADVDLELEALDQDDDLMINDGDDNVGGDGEFDDADEAVRAAFEDGGQEPIDDLQIPDVDLEAERLEGANEESEAGAAHALQDEGKADVELDAVAGENEQDEDYVASQAVDDETANGDGTEYADFAEENLEGEHAEDNLVEAVPDASAENVPSSAGEVAHAAVPSDSATLPTELDTTSVQEPDYSAQDDAVAASLAPEKNDPLDDVDIDYSVDPEASAPSSPASPAKTTGNVRDSTAAELDSPAAAVKKRRTSITDEATS